MGGGLVSGPDAPLTREKGRLFAVRDRVSLESWLTGSSYPIKMTFPPALFSASA